MGYKVNPVTGEMSEYIFEIGGIMALRNFTARTIGERLIIESATNANFVLLDAFVGEVQIDGVVYDDPIAAQEALQRLVFNPHVPVLMTLAQQQLLLGALQKGSYSGTASELKQHLETLINTKVTQEPGKGLISDAEKTDIAENKKKRVEDFTITGDVDKIFTLIYNDGSTKAKSFTDIVGQALADVMLNSLNFNKDTGVLTGVRSDGQQITADQNGRWALLNHSHAWNDITGKPATFPPSPHTHVVNWNDVQNKPDLSQLGAKPVIKVTVDTASHLKDKIGTTTAGNYVPQEGDELVVDFTNGTWVNNVTLNIDGSGVKNVKLVGKNVDRNHLSVSPNSENKIVRMWYDGSYYQMYGATVNTTYGNMTIEHARDNTTTTSAFLVSAQLLAWVRNWANIIGKPFKLIGNVLNIVNPTKENEFINIKAKGFEIPNATENHILLANGMVGNLGSFSATHISTKGLDPNKYYLLTFPLSQNSRYKFIFHNALNSNKPVWASHDNGFSLYYEFEVNGDGWGAISYNHKDIDIHYRFCGDPQICPVSHSRQLTNNSIQYIYLRGDAIYNIYYRSTGHTDVNFTLHNTDGTYAIAGGQSLPKTLEIGNVHLPKLEGYYNRRELLVFKGVDVTSSIDWTATNQVYSNTVFLKGGGNKTIRLHQLENHTIMSFKKCYDGGTITFVCQGKTIVMRGADAFNGADGSNAVVSIVDNKCYIDINNYD